MTIGTYGVPRETAQQWEKNLEEFQMLLFIKKHHLNLKGARLFAKLMDNNKLTWEQMNNLLSLIKRHTKKGFEELEMGEGYAKD